MRSRSSVVSAAILVFAFCCPPFDIAYAQSATSCDAYARNYAKNASRQGQIIGRGAVGSLLGAGIGAAFDGAGVGAAVGASVGLISGGSSRRRAADQMYAAAYQDCMAGRAP